MNPSTQKSILQMARGAIMERADYEMSRLLANILDPNTSATAKRKLTLTLELKPDDDRQGGTRADLKSKGKVATLACGYQGSVGALIQMGALESGIPEDELPGIVQMWRKANKNIVRFWYEVEDAAMA